jgi:thioesterase domain-containing protein
MNDLWASRFVIRNEAHGVPIPDDEEDPDEAFSNENLPLAWTRWLDLPELPEGASLAASDALITEAVVDLSRQTSRKQSKVMHDLMDHYWDRLVESDGEKKEETRQKLELFPAKGDVAKLQRLVSLTIDGFNTQIENGNWSVSTQKVTMLRDFVLYFLYNPTSDSASGFNANIKKRVIQWYRS